MINLTDEKTHVFTCTKHIFTLHYNKTTNRFAIQLNNTHIQEFTYLELLFEFSKKECLNYLPIDESNRAYKGMSPIKTSNGYELCMDECVIKMPQGVEHETEKAQSNQGEV